MTTVIERFGEAENSIFICDTLQDRDNIQNGKFGDCAVIINGDTFILNSQGTWIKNTSLFGGSGGGGGGGGESNINTVNNIGPDANKNIQLASKDIEHEKSDGTKLPISDILGDGLVDLTTDQTIKGTKTFETLRISKGPVVLGKPLSTNIGTQTIMIGDSVVGPTQNSISIGNNSRALRNECIAIGLKADAYNQFSIAIGSSATTLSGDYAMAIGYEAKGAASAAIAIGYQAISKGNSSITIGVRATTIDNNNQYKSLAAKSIAIGYEASAGSASITDPPAIMSAIAIGDRAKASWVNSIVIGSEAQSNALDSIVIGTRASTTNTHTDVSYHARSIAIGYEATAKQTNQHGTQPNASAIAIGDRASTIQAGGIAIGQLASASGSRSIAIGEEAKSLTYDTISIGYATNNESDGGIVLGYQAGILGNNVLYGVAIGRSSRVLDREAIAIGAMAKCEATGIAIGNQPVNGARRSIAIGGGATTFTSDKLTLGQRSIAIGHLTKAGVTENSPEISGCVAIGSETVATAERSTAIGYLAQSNSPNSIAIGTEAKTISGDVTKGGQSIAIGYQASAGSATSTAEFTNSIAIGTNSTCTSEGIAIGRNALTSGGVSIGYNTSAKGMYGVSIGTNCSSSGGYGVAIGLLSNAAGTYTVAICSNSHAKEMGSIAVGYESGAYGLSSTTVGYKSASSEKYALSFGSNARSYGESNITIGGNTKNGTTTGYVARGTAFSVVVGGDSTMLASKAIAIGHNTKVGGVTETDELIPSDNSIVIGADSQALAENVVAIGKENNVSGVNSIVLGSSNIANGSDNIFIGTVVNTADNNDKSCIAIGNNITLNGREQYSIAIGDSAVVRNGNTGLIAIGTQASAVGINSTALGFSAKALATDSIAIGYQAISSDIQGIAIGDRSTAKRYGVSVGHSAYANATNATAIGNSTQVNSTRCTAIGSNARILDDTLTNSTIIGYQATCETPNTIVLGNSEITSLQCNVTTISELSDTRVKENIEPANLDLCLQSVKDLPISRYSYKDFVGKKLDKHVTGWLADDVEKVFPKAVTSNNRTFYKYNEDGEVIEGEEIVIEDLKNITMTEALPTLWGAVQKLISVIDDQEFKMKQMQSQLDMLIRGF